MKKLSGRYFVLAGLNYYPAAWEDYQGSFTTKKEAIAEADAHREGKHGNDWAEVVDKRTMKVIYPVPG